MGRFSLPAIAPASIRTYALVTILSGVVMLGGFGWLALNRLSHLNEAAEANNRENAQKELSTTLYEVISTTKSLAQSFAEWDETHQQLSTPTYYAYWRQNRAGQASFVPQFFTAIEIYDEEGSILAPSAEVDIPDIFSLLKSEATITKINNQSSIFYHAPIIADPKNNHSVGDVVVKLDFLSALRAIQKFRYVDANSIDISIPNEVSVPAVDIIEHIQYDIRSDLKFQELQGLMVNTLNKLGLIAGAFSLLFWYLIITLVGLPLRRLTNYIDNLKSGEMTTVTGAVREIAPLKEIVKVRQSLHDYQNQLTESASALRESESQKQAILDNVVDGIITANSLGEIASHNPAAARIFGFSPTELENQRLKDLIHKSSYVSFQNYLERHDIKKASDNFSNEPCELTAVHKDGSSIPIELAMSEMESSNSTLRVYVVRDISERKRAEQRLVYLANYDTLTGLPNRVLLKDRLKHAMAQAKRNDRLVGLLFLDLDRFKTINDSLGHHVGDQLLKQVAKRITEHVRDCDTVSRLGGDEFTIVLESLSHVDEVFMVSQKICEMFAQPFNIESRQIFVATSIGVTVYPFDDTDEDNLLKNADIAMYRAKENGGNTHAFYEPSMDANAAQWLAMENDLRNALDKDELFLCYQPRVDLKTGEILSAEALLRWKHPEHGLVSPTEFIPLLEETGLIVKIGEWVIKTACEQIQKWETIGLPSLRVAVNLSPRQFRQTDLIETLKNTLELSGISPTFLELEITESMLIENVDVAAETLSAAHDLGVHVSVDDFGTGYSSLSYLKRFRISTLKIDRSFIKDITTDVDDAAIASAIVALAKSLDLNVTAEGVETVEQLAIVRQLGCDEAQGYLFSKPLPSQDFQSLLEQRPKFHTIEEVSVEKRN